MKLRTRLNLVVEVNPTSNLVIGDLATLAEHPVFRFSSPRANGDETKLRVALCDDDPITFATSLSDEVAYIHAALQHRQEASARVEVGMSGP